MGESALIVFIKNPVAGAVKTRLAATMGNEKALAIYHRLLDYTLQVTKDIAVAKYIFYSSFIPSEDVWKQNNYHQQLQEGNDLGERMQHAFQLLFDKGYTSVVIIGSDCIELTTDGIDTAFEQLNDADIVIGPANDGGYYLLGMKRLHPFVFKNKKWSTGQLYDQTVEECYQQALTIVSLPLLIDIDDEADLQLYYAGKR